jgi:NOL1/NOP2/sun family putative RNA methylase
MNDKFKEYFRGILGGQELEEFLRQVQDGESVKKALRINTLLCKPKQKLIADVFDLEPLLWNSTGYFYKSKIAIGNTDHYKRGHVYSQEASSQVAAELLDVKEKQVILDLCASPGSKTTHIAALAKNNAFIIANEIDSTRYLKLRNNLRHYGVICHAISSLDPMHFAQNYTNIFDRILVDAPCTGEGMYFKFPAVLNHWNMKTVKFNARRQKNILTRAFEALKPGGKIVYSTCTLNLEENEKVVDYLLKKYLGNAKLENIDMKHLGLSGTKDGTGEKRKAKEPMLKLWPQEFQTGGFFACVITKTSATEMASVKEKVKLTSRQKRQAAHRVSTKFTEAKASWKICSRKEVLSVENMINQVLEFGGFKTPENFVIVKKDNTYFLQHSAFYRRFQDLPVRSLGLPILVKHENGSKKATPECLRWLNIE